MNKDLKMLLPEGTKLTKKQQETILNLVNYDEPFSDEFKNNIKTKYDRILQTYLDFMDDYLEDYLKIYVVFEGNKCIVRSDMHRKCPAKWDLCVIDNKEIALPWGPVTRTLFGIINRLSEDLNNYWGKQQ